MTHTPHPEYGGLSPDLEELVAQYCEGCASGEQIARLGERLKNDPQAREFFLAFLEVDGQLRWEFGPPLPTDFPDQDDKPAAGVSKPTSTIVRTTAAAVSRFFARPTALSLAVAALVIGLLMTAMAFMAPPFYRAITQGGNDAQPVDVLRVVAKLTGAHKPVWAEGHTEHRLGAHLLANGRLSLQEGLVELTMRNGARVVVEAPAELQLIASDEIAVKYGKTVVRVPKQAVGFTVVADNLQVRDLGTEFGIKVPQDRAYCGVEVFEGAVELTIRGRNGPISRREIHAGDAVRVRRSDNHLLTVPPAPGQFARQLPEHDRYEKHILRDKPLAYWPLTEPSGSKIAHDLSENRRNGEVVGGVAFGGDGPTDASSSAIFDGTGMISVGQQAALGKTNDFTIEAWIWIDDPNHHGRIIVADKGPIAGQQYGWDLAYSPAVGPLPSPNGHNCLKFTFLGSRSYYFEKAVIEPSRWHHIAVASMPDGGLALFVDGELAQLVKANAGKKGPTHVTLGRAGSERQYVAHWKGRLAHVAFYERALNSDEILSHYNAHFDSSPQ